MVVSFTIPDPVADSMRLAFGDLGRAAVERLAIDGYSSGLLSHFEIQQLLGFDNRWDTDDWLGAHGATMPHSAADLESDRRTLDSILGPIAS